MAGEQGSTHPARRQGKAVHRRTRMSGQTTAQGMTGSTGRGWRARWRYKFDNALARGPFVVIAYLALLSLLVVLATAIVTSIFTLPAFGGASGHSFGENVWQAMLRTVDAGSFAADSGWRVRFLALLTTLAGIFLAGSLIGLIANAVDQKVEELRRGRSAVVEDGHTLILGWSPQVPRIINELVIANESEKRAAVVVLARGDKMAMEDELRDRVEDAKTTAIVCRSGNPAVPDDLRRASIETARSVVIVSDSDGDAGVVKAVLAVRAVDPAFEQAHVVAEISDRDHAATVRTVSDGRVLTISSDDVVAEVTAQACLQAGLASVFKDLLDFDGDELYFIPADGLAGHTYREALLGFERSSVIGRLTADGVVELNPATDVIVDAADELILVAADDSTIQFTGVIEVTMPDAPLDEVPELEPQHIVLVGWSSFGTKVLQELDEFVPVGSVVEVVVDEAFVDPTWIGAHQRELDRIELRVRSGGARTNDLRDVTAGRDPDQVIVLGYRDHLTADEADARTLLTLITLRRTWPAGGRVRIVAELLDQRHLVLADPMGVDDLIVSDALSSLLMAQLSERAELQTVFDELFDSEGAIVQLHTCASYVPPVELTYGHVVAAGAELGVSVIGYRVAAERRVVMNPPKSSAVRLAGADQVIVIAART